MSKSKPLTFAQYIAHQIDGSELTQREIAEALGYDRPNIITMFKQGATKVPLEKVPGLAKALGLDPAHLLSLAMKEYVPEVYRTIQDTFGRTVTQNEYAIIEAIREITKERNPPMTKELKVKLKEVLGAPS